MNFFAGSNLIVFAEKEEMTDYQKLFIATAINKLNFGGYDNYPTKTSIVKETIKLPAIYNAEKEEYEPDWNYMEELIRKLKEDNKGKLASLKEIKPADDEIDISDWHGFEIGKLFKAITKTAKIKDFTREINRTNECSIPALSSLAINNSHGFYVKKSEHDLINAPCLSVTSNGINAGTVFVQLEPFAIIQDAYALLIKDYNLDQEIYLFLSTALQKLLIDRYGFNEKAVWSKVKKESLQLPAIYNHEKEEYEPDWEYMENFITNMQRDVKNQLRRLRQNEWFFNRRCCP